MQSNIKFAYMVKAVFKIPGQRLLPVSFWVTCTVLSTVEEQQNSMCEWLEVIETFSGETKLFQSAVCMYAVNKCFTSQKLI